MDLIIGKSIDLSNIPQELHSQVPSIVESIKSQLKSENEIALAKFKDDLRQSNELAIRESMKEFEENERKNRKPLTPEELQRMLSQEYVTFNVEVQTFDEENIPKKHTFILRELPQQIEKELYVIVKDRLNDLAKEYSNFSFKANDDILSKIVDLADMFTPVQEVLAKLCAMCLNPRKKLDYVTPEWVADNLSNFRIASIILAQTEVSKMRDFFSILFQGFQRGTMITQANVQQ